MDQINILAERVRASTTLPGLLDAGFDAFEAIRSAARACEDRTPDLFAAFMTAAGTAVEGRNALLGAPSLPQAPTGPRPGVPTVTAADDIGHIADELAALAGLLARRLLDATASRAGRGDRTACQHAAHAAAEIRRLLARDHDASLTR